MGHFKTAALILADVEKIAAGLRRRDIGSLPNLDRYHLYRAVAEAYWHLDQRDSARPVIDELFNVALRGMSEGVMFGELFSSLCGTFILHNDWDIRGSLRGVRGYQLEIMVKELCSFAEGASVEETKVYWSFVAASAQSDLASCASVILGMSELMVPYRPKSEVEQLVDVVIQKAGIREEGHAKQVYGRG